MTITDARRDVGAQLGLTGFDGSREAYSELSPADQERVSIATVRYVAENPSQFGSDQVEAARKLATKQNFGSVGDYRNPDLLDNAAEFLSAYSEVAGETVVGVAGVAGRGAKALGLDLGILVAVIGLGAVAYLGAPIVFPQLRSAAK